MKKILLITLFIIIFCSILKAQNHTVPYTLEDRDRLIRLEVEQKSLRNEIISLRNEMNTRFESLQTQISDLKQSNNDIKTLFYWGFGILITLFLFLFGYIIFDRSIARGPVREKKYSLDKKMKAIEKVLKEFGKEQPKFAKILKSYGLL